MVGMKIIPQAANHIHIIVSKEHYLDLYTDCSEGTRIVKRDRKTNENINQVVIP